MSCDSLKDVSSLLKISSLTEVYVGDSDAFENLSVLDNIKGLNVLNY